MGGIIRTLGKGLKGAAAVAVPAAFAEQERRVLAQRDAVLRGYQKEDQATARANELADQATARANELADQQEAREERGLDRAAEATYRADTLGIQRDQLDLTASQIAQQLEIGEFTLTESKRLRDLHDIIVNPNSSKEAISGAVETINLLKGENPDKYQAITLYGEENEMGIQRRASGILNTRTGRLSGVGPEAIGTATSGFEIGRTYPDADGNTAVYMGKGADGNDIWDDGSAPAPEVTRQPLLAPPSVSPPIAPGGIINSRFRVPESGRGAATGMPASDAMTQTASGTNPPQTLTKSEVAAMGFTPDGYTKMTSGNYVLRSGASSKDWVDGKFIDHTHGAINKRAREIYAELNRNPGRYDSTLMARARKQAEEELSR